MAQEGKTGQGIHMADLIDCPKCGYSNAVGTRYCGGCGASLAGVRPHGEGQAGAKPKRGLGKLLGRKDPAA